MATRGATTNGGAPWARMHSRAHPRQQAATHNPLALLRHRRLLLLPQPRHNRRAFSEFCSAPAEQNSLFSHAPAAARNFDIRLWNFGNGGMFCLLRRTAKLR